MSIELKIPTVGESITEVQVGEWFKSEGDAVRKDENVVEIESDKATVELPAPVSGRIIKVLKAAGAKAEVGEVIGYMEEAEVGAAAPAKPAQNGPAAAASPAAGNGPTASYGTSTPPGTAPATAATAPSSAHVMPAARREAHDRGIKPEEVTGTGPGGRVLKEDVVRHAETAKTSVATTQPKTIAVPAPAGGPVLVQRAEELVPMTPLRRKIAERLVNAQQAAALLTTFNEVDMSAVMALRAEHKETFQKKYNVKLGFMSFFIKATIEALKATPQLNAEIRGNDIVYRNYYDVGIAVSGGKGLVVPVVRNAERMSFAEIEIAIENFGARARDNKIKLEELEGGTFTISNGGVFGSMLSTPIVNPPQSGILGLHAIQDRPVARAGQVVIRPMMYLALTYDHRIVDGREAVTFLRRVKEGIEEPARLLLEI